MKLLKKIDTSHYCLRGFEFITDFKEWHFISGGLVRVSGCPMASGPLMKWAPLNIRQYVKNVNDLLMA
jgi:hypothetical protein